MKRLVTMIALVGFVTLPTLAQEPRLPQGKWWENKRVAERLELSPNQIGQLDAVAEKAAMQLIDLRAEMEKAILALGLVLENDNPDVEAAREAVARVNKTRAAMFEREVMTLLGFRSVLTTEQWKLMRNAMQRRDDSDLQRRRPNRKPGQRNPGRKPRRP